MIYYRIYAIMAAISTSNANSDLSGFEIQIISNNKKIIYRNIKFFNYLEGGDTLEDFLDGFPTVSRALALEALEEAKQLLLART